MNKVTLIAIVTLLIGLSSCNKHSKQKQLIEQHVQTLEEGNVLDLNVRFIEIELQKSTSTKDSLDIIMKVWDQSLVDSIDHYKVLIDSIEIAQDSLWNVYMDYFTNYNQSGNYLKQIRKQEKAFNKWEIAIDIYKEYSVIHSAYKDSLISIIPYDVNDPIVHQADLESRNNIYNIYKTTYKIFNPALGVDQTLTKSFVFDSNSTIIIKSL